MGSKSRTGRSTLAATALLAAIGVSGMAPTIAAAEPHSRTAPYDFGMRCTEEYPLLPLSRCDPDPIAMMTGAITTAGTETTTALGYLENGSNSSVGIVFDVAQPGSLTVVVDAVAVDADAVGSSTVCVQIVDEAGDRKGGFGCTSGSGFAGPVRVSHEVTLPAAGRYSVLVSVDASGLGPSRDRAAAALVREITYELTP